ncbi:cytochrome c [Pararhizobium sp. IMCC21322]|uniref:c-type cytochrome n=1 Tax=Pararhizobium sp. IMCC21322 TaxID=3067903 RepID=UPI002741AD6F|nr:cytochrome c [Pararhizobium sp. IMCC21322]
MKYKILTATLLAAFATGPVFGADDPIAARKAIMQNVGAATGAGAGMVKGETEFNAVTAALVLRTMNAAALGFGELFPEGSESGGKTTVAPSIWDDRAGFDMILAKFQSDTAAGIAAKPADLDAFKAAFGVATTNCAACHKDYRVKKE